MTKIGILTCLYSNNVCARVGCLKAFNSRTGHFSEYGPEDTLVAMMTCNGCKSWREPSPSEDQELLEKVERLSKEEIDVVHVGVCSVHHGKECGRMTELCGIIENRGIRVVRGTHA